MTADINIVPRARSAGSRREGYKFLMPSCLAREIERASEGEFPPRYELIETESGRVIGVHFINELHWPYEDLGLCSMISVAWRGQATEIAAPVCRCEESGRMLPTPHTYEAPYEERVAATLEGIRRLESDYQRRLNELDNSR